MRDTLSPPGQDGPRVVWLSGAFGYSGELLYFEDIFAAFAERFPRGVVPVAEGFPVDRYPELPLRPLLRFVRLGAIRRTVDSVEYRSVRRFLSPRSLFRLARLRPDVLLTVEFSYVALAGFMVAKLTRTRTVILVESDPRYRGAPNSRVARLVKSVVARHADVVLVSNEIGAQYLIDVLGVPRAKVTIGPYLTSDPGRTAGSPVPPTQTGPVRLVFLNSVNERKGVAELLQALARTNPALRSEWQLDLYGSGPFESGARDLVEKLGLEVNVTFHGRVDYRNAADCYAASDLVISPSLADYRSLSGFEAVNSGRPLLVSERDGASAELAELAPAVIVVDPRDIGGLAETLEPLLTRDGPLPRLQAAALRVPVEFQMASVADNVAAAVHRALGFPMAR